MRMFGENLWVTMLFWLIIILLIALLVYCCVTHAIKKGEEQEKKPEWYLREVEARPENYCQCKAELSQQRFGSG